ncbi:MAG: PAS domain S-box protein [Alphaproteobacteria bacterium]|jgi:PAS domain S-box-containing protein|nr:PAS domain S-box protein [Alphaproteobacteria bacterium]
MVEAGWFARQPSDADEAGLVRLFDELYDPAFLIDVEAGRFLGVNRAALQLLGYDAAEMEGLTPADIHPHEIPKLDAFVAEVLARGRWAADDLACRTRTGVYVPADVRATLVTIGGRRCVLSIVRDRRPAEDAALGQSLRRLMHDLRNTLATTQLAGDRLMDHPDAAVRRSADTIARSLERAVEMCRTTLRLGRAAPPAPRRERFLLADVLGEVAASLPAAELLVDASAGPVGVDADYDQCYRILLNLARNAHEAGARRLRVAGEATGGTVHLTVTDDGPGLPDDVRAHLFDEAPARKPAGGSGLGLAIARELARNHEGELELLETGPAGTTFRIVLPTS